MNITFLGNPRDICRVEEGTYLLLQDMNISDKADLSLTIHVEFREEPKLTVTRTLNSIHIICREPAHYFRGLTMALNHLKEPEYSQKETSYFPRNGLMLDCSRNSVFTVEKVKSLIRILARLGLNVLMLYTEDTYQVPGEPYFGAYRGAYTRHELQEIDEYALKFGIELVPCIQTLAHLHNCLKWPMGDKIKDTPDILQVGKEETYQFIEELLKAVKDTFRTRRVHLGMDEAVQLGLGNYLKENGYKKSSLLMKEHCTRVLAICKKLGLQPMIWSDMYITSNSGCSYYEVPEGVDCSTWEKPEPDLGLVYWDYYNTDSKVYEKMLQVHWQLSGHIAFAGGCWIWNGIAPDYSRSFECTQAALSMCKKYHVQEVFCTGWMDNGAETPVDTVIPGAALFAHLGFHKEFDQREFEEEFYEAVGGRLEDFMKLDKFDRLFLGDAPNLSSENPSKYLLYQDPLLGIFDYHLKNIDAGKYYRELTKEMEEVVKTSPGYNMLFTYYYYLAKVLSDKADLGVQIKTAYDRHDLPALDQICDKTIPELTGLVEKMQETREELWMSDSKPFGYELLDLRLGGIIIRLKSCRRRLKQYLSGAVSILEELEGERLPYFPEGEPAMENRWQRIISGADLTDTI